MQTLLVHREVKDLDENHSAFLTHGEGGRLSRRWKLALGGPSLRGPYNSSSQLQQTRVLATSMVTTQTVMLREIRYYITK